MKLGEVFNWFRFVFVFFLSIFLFLEISFLDLSRIEVIEFTPKANEIVFGSPDESAWEILGRRSVEGRNVIVVDNENFKQATSKHYDRIFIKSEYYSQFIKMWGICDNRDTVDVFERSIINAGYEEVKDVRIIPRDGKIVLYCKIGGNVDFFVFVYVILALASVFVLYSLRPKRK